MEISGKVKVVGGVQQIGASFQKRELIIETTEQYPQTLCVEFVQDKTSLIEGLDVGQGVTVSINIRGREWTNPQGEVKYFTSLQGWKLTALGQAAPSAPVGQVPDSIDGLPF